MSDAKPVRTVDVRGQICPYPIIETRKVLKEIKPGEVIEVITDNPPTAQETLPQLCTMKKMPFERAEVSPGVWRFRITKTE
jgi:tRNA 2-thiouridine synthesizing protein A